MVKAKEVTLSYDTVSYVGNSGKKTQVIASHDIVSFLKKQQW